MSPPKAHRASFTEGRAVSSGGAFQSKVVIDIAESDQTFRRSLPNANIAIKLAKKIMAHSLSVGIGAGLSIWMVNESPGHV